MLYTAHAALLASMAMAVSIPPAELDAPLKLDFSSLLKNSNGSSSENNQHLQLDFSVLRGKDGSLINLDTKGDFVEDNYPFMTLVQTQTYYAAVIGVGSNGDENIVAVDTGSSDLWVMSTNVACNYQQSSKRSAESWPHFRDFQSEKQGNTNHSFEKGKGESRINDNSCTTLGSFNAQGSLTFQLNSSAPAFSISYVGGQKATGVWGTDTVYVGSMKIHQCSLGVVTSSSSLFGIFGIGLTPAENTNYGSTPYQYQNFPQLLKRNGIIQKTSYSLYLNGTTSKYGSILFGAVDHAKYSGQLQTVPIVNSDPSKFSKPPSFDVVLDSITLENSKQIILVSTTPFAAVLDSGTTLTYLPQPIMDSLASLLKAKFSTAYNLYELSCEYLTSSAYVVYNFSGAQIGVPLSELVIPAGNSQCLLGVLPVSNDVRDVPEAILGDNFLRHAYIVYNLDDYEISLAQVQYSSNSNIDIISSSVPLAVRAPGYSSTYLTPSIPAQPKVAHLKASGLGKSKGFSSTFIIKSLLFAFAGLGLVLVF